MATKMFVNHVNDTVSESLAGFCSAYPRLDYHASKRVVLENNWHQRGNKVAIVCGGGSGHEPFAAGFVGAGMLTAAVAGSVFAAPPSSHILHAFRCVSRNNDAGVLVIIPNYTGDRLNFGIAIEGAKQDDLKIADVIVGDDCSIPIEEQGRAGKRGLVGLLFVIKIAGSLAQSGKSLDEITREIQIAAQNIATYGVGFSPCSLPGHGPMFEIPRDEIEIGLGVHGEAGYKRIQWSEASKIVEILLDRIIETLLLIEGCSVAVIVNNFGASSQLEQAIVVHEVAKQLKNRGILLLRIYFGSLMTSLGSAGMHVSILHLTDDKLDLFVKSLDDETDAPCWPGRSYSVPLNDQPTIHIDEMSRKAAQFSGRKFNDQQTALMGECLKNVCVRIIQNEEKINNLDSGCGDGDCGFTHRQLAEERPEPQILISLSHLKALSGEKSEPKIVKYRDEVQRKLDAVSDKGEWETDDVIKYPVDHDYTLSLAIDCIVYYATGILSSLDRLHVAYPASLLMQLSCIAEEQMGGTSGAIYSIMFKAAASELAQHQKDEDWSRVWLRVWKRGIAAVTKYSKATSGDRTMLDTLIPACTALEENLSNLIDEIVEKVTKAAWSGCEATRHMKPMTGRASYVKQRQFLNDVDAGSFAVAIWINAVAETFAKF